MRLPRIIVICLIVFSGSSAAMACQCVTPNIPDSFSKAAMVFSGAVAKIEAVSEKSIHHEDKIIVHFTPTKFWKGTVKKEIILNTVYNQLSCDGYWFKEGKVYLVFVKNNEDGTLGTTFCLGTKEIEYATSEIAQLDQLIGTKNEK